MSQPSRAPHSVYAFDARPLTSPIDPEALRSWRQQMKARGTPDPGAAQGWVLGFMIALCVVFALVGVALLPPILARAGIDDLPLLIVPILFLAVPTLIGAVAVRAVRGGRHSGYRLDHFARANGMEYVPRMADPRLPGLIFNRGSGRIASDRVRGTRPRFVEFGNYRYTTGSGKNRRIHNWGYVAIHLDAPLPHIVLDALGNNSLFGSNLPTAFDRDQRLSLEGDFDRHFALYCPQGYERDALYLFTPDIMARFIDHAGQLDVEIVDDWLFLYMRRGASTLDPATWAWLFSVVAALMDKLAQWGRWRDERLAREVAPSALPATPGALPFREDAAHAPPPPAPAPGVAAQGRRLRKGWTWASVAAVILAVTWIAANVLRFLLP
ncbi:DUF3137 domain-containing protein [Microbacterium sp. Marseille-Q6965]|uniref:DUF3137 domain-containing protein n=1 Tax=Microbacterium sp. Marseille-Q6965 TaxID=2965072 RepID=UPI0021B727C3|nr:DUF3137 domain-containing protein [Microbacterium sp. Marseille-Q6965]